MENSLLSFSFNWNGLAIIMIALVVFIGLCVCSFASRYMRGDIKYHSFFAQLIMLVVSVSVMVSTDNLVILLASCSLNNILLVRLMIHKSNWKAAKASGMMAAKNYCLSIFFMGSAFIIFYTVTGESSVNAIIYQDSQSIPMILALVLIIMTAMTQSAIWPFHRWLISSLNSPTPVSAIMHAGLINGGGFLLIRFAPLYLQHPTLLLIIFSIGLTTALLGTLWKLMQHDVKRMLACSTMGQMGFMFAQCGLGLFPMAVAHLVWHGLFKAYLFLASGSAAQERKFKLDSSLKLPTIMCSLLCSLCGSISFGYASNKSWITVDSTLILMVTTLIAATQFALTILRIKTLRSIPLALISTAVMGLFYGFSVHAIAWLMEPMQLMQPAPLNAFHIIGIVALTLTWLSFLLFRAQAGHIELHSWLLRGYVAALNSSQPNSETVTAHRNLYQY